MITEGILSRGVSVVICCYNSALRIPRTLEALAQQQTRHDLDWEVIVVDNSSTDNTSTVANNSLKLFQPEASVGFQVVAESQQGLIYARMKGVSRAKFDKILFCDDDNWLSNGYLQRIADILDHDPAVAACGGKGIPYFETGKPEWFDDFSEAFAVGSQHINTVNGRLVSLYGAGMAVRAKALIHLKSAGFQPVMKGRTGAQLSSAEDTELCYAFVLSGFRLIYDETISFTHFLPRERLNYAYLLRLFRSFGADGPVRNLYFSYLGGHWRYEICKSWLLHLLLAVLRAVKYQIDPPKRNARKIFREWSKSYIKQLWKLRMQYPQLKKGIESLVRAEMPPASLAREEKLVVAG